MASRATSWARSAGVNCASAQQALDTALGLSDGLQARALAQFTPAERAQLVALLARARAGLLSLQAEVIQ